MRRTLIALIFLIITTMALYVSKQVNDILVSWAIETYNEPTATYLTIVEFRFFELGLSSITTCYAFNLYFYLFHRKVFKYRDNKGSFTLDFLIPPALLVPLFFMNQIAVLIVKGFIVIPSYVRTINSIYTTITVFICISYVIVKHIYGIDWRMLNRITRYLIKYTEHIVIYVAIGFVVYAFLTILVVNTAYMSISRVTGAEANLYGVFLTLLINMLEAIILFVYFLTFIEPLINEVKLDAVMKKYV